jgi:phage I-like protein
MAKKTEQLEIELDPIETKVDEPEVEVVEAEAEPEAKGSNVLLPEDGIKELQAKLESERQARILAEKRAQEAAEREFRAKTETEDTQIHLIKNAMDTVKRNNDLLKAQYRDAMAVGDYDAAANIQDALSANHVKLSQLEAGHKAMQDRPKQAPPQPQYTDHVEALASQVTEPSAQWLRANRDRLGNQKTIDKMFRAHADALDDGVIPDSREYFEYIENRLGFKKYQPEPEVDAMADAAKVTQRRSSPPAAPVSRSGNGTGSTPNVVRLTAAEREMAQMMGMTDKEYALNKVALQREGKLN